MNADLQLIRNLQEADDKIGRLRRDIDAIPREIEDLKKHLLKAQEELHNLNEQMSDDEKKRKSLERAVEDRKAQLLKSKGKVPEVKTNKEYSALLSEIENMEKTIYGSEDEILNIMELMEQKAALKKDKERAEKVETELFNRLKEQKEKELEQLNQELNVRMAERTGLAVGLRKPLLEQYERLRQIRHGLAVVSVVDEVCQGCHMTLPPQLVAEIIGGEEVILCAHCNRILFITP